MSAEHLSRRSFLTRTPKLVAGAAVGAEALGLAATPEAEAQSTTTFPYPYAQLDPSLVAQRAYDGYYTGKGCMYATFEGLIGELREKVGAPYTTFPVNMMEYGKGGVNGIWGTLCGSLNAAAAAINLISSTPAPLINEVYFWYSQEMLPAYRPATPKYDIVNSVPGSPLCHISVQNWCAVSGFKPTSPERAERCACLSAAVAKYTAEVLNKQLAGTFVTAHTQPNDIKRCLSCHGKDADENVNQGANMACTPCHSEIVQGHPNKRLLIRWTGNGTLESAESAAGPWSATASQSNPQPLATTNATKFFRLK